jgi:hypothetical protein
MGGGSFEAKFKSLTGAKPLSWQQRLYKNHFKCGQLPPMAIWLIARAQSARVAASAFPEFVRPYLRKGEPNV